jgi:ADP-ribose pyrophosphatase
MSKSHDDEGVLHEGRFIRMVRRDGWEYVEHPGISGIVVVVAVTDDGKLLLVEQLRRPVQRRVLELPAGMVGDLPGQRDEDFTLAARRELQEETGYDAASFERLMAGPYSPGRSSDLYTFYRARGLRRVGEGGGDEHEDIVVHEVPMEGIDAWLEARSAEGLLIDPKIYAGLYFIGRRAGA